jgi:alpha-amylase
LNEHLLTTSQAQLTQCWVGGNLVPLPDLKTESPRVREGYNTWIKSLTSNYSIDGLRLDTVLQVEKGFWKGFRDAVDDMYMIGEIFQEGADFVCDYQNVLSGLFNYPVYFPLINAFKSTSGDMAKLSESIDKTAVACKDISLLGSFSENHDNARFPSQQGDIAQAANVITFTMVADGIPILYQGQEQHYDARGGANDPYNREALWFSGYNTDSQLYKLVANLNKARKNAIRNDPSFLTTGANPIYTDTTTIAVKKGKLMTVLSNKGSQGDNYTQAIRSYYQSGSSVTELLSCTKFTADSDSFLNVPMGAGMPRVFYPTADIGTLCGGATQDSVASASSEVETAETYSDSTSSDSSSSSSSSSDSTVLDSSMSRPARPNRPSRPNRASRNRAARPSRAKLARRSSGKSNKKAARWAA